MTQAATILHTAEPAAEQGWIRGREWDRIFITGGAVLVAVPILLFFVLREIGLTIAAAEDVVTLVVMVLVGGPHVFVTYTRTILEPRFVRREKVMFVGGLGVIAIVVGAAISSAFYQATLSGHPLMQFVMTFFFFWAGIHIVHQASFCAACYEAQRGKTSDRRRRFHNALDYLVMLGCLYPVSFFRMSMVGENNAANPDALATSLVAAMTDDPHFVDDYMFRIGRVAPILPDLMTADAFWVGFSVLFAVLLGVWAHKSWMEWRDGTLNRPRFTLVAATVVVGLIVPVFPNLDSSFQGFNSWHSFQYLGLVWLLNRRAYDRGEMRGRLVRWMSAPHHARRYYGMALLVTASLLLVIYAAALGIESQSGGKFALFGHDVPPVDPVTGREEYRPGAVLLAYYMVAFSLLLVHYLHDGIFFFRTRDLVDDRG